MKNKKPIIFISHIHEEGEIANKLKQLIDEVFTNQIDVFLSSNEDSLRLGDNQLDVIKQMLINTDLLITICSPISINRNWISLEAGACWIKNIPIIPLCINGLDFKDLPAVISTFQGTKIDIKSQLDNLFVQIQNILGCNFYPKYQTNFIDELKEFNEKVNNNSLVENISFINNFLEEDFKLLQIGLFQSIGLTNLPKEYSEEILNFSDSQFKIKRKFLFFFAKNGIYKFDIKKLNYQVFYEIAKQLFNNIQYILLDKDIKIPQYFRNNLRNNLIMFKNEVEDWYNLLNLYLLLKPDEIESKNLQKLILENEKGDLEIEKYSFYDGMNKYSNTLVDYFNWYKQIKKEITHILNSANKL